MSPSALARIHPFKLHGRIEAARQAAKTGAPEAVALVTALEGEWRRRQLAEIARRAAEPEPADDDLFDRCAE